jgi:uncharacterized protein (TIGR00288 family)
MQHVAVLIDSENVGARNWPKIRERIDRFGRITICRVFGNFTEDRLAPWLKIAQEEALQPIMQFAGSNACDIAIAVSAMDLLHTGKLQAICLVSSDGDFTPLVHRLKAGGLAVYGVGNSKASAALKRACTEFVAVSDLLKPVAVAKAA